MKAWVGIDNGVSGSLAMVTEKGQARFAPTPTRVEQSYTKTVQQITRIDGQKLYTWLLDSLSSMDYLIHKDRVLVILERPFVNPKGFKATVSGLRALEATLIVCESLLLPVQYIDSREWQKVMLPEGLQGPAELKAASLDIGRRLFPQIDSKMKDRDSLLIAEFARRKNL